MSAENEKDIVFVSGVMSYFCYREPFNGGDKSSFYFKGSVNGEKLARTIKVSKYARGFDVNDSILAKSDYPLYDHIYKCDLQLETWEWEGRKCMRALAFKIVEDLGENQNLKSPF